MSLPAKDSARTVAVDSIRGLHLTERFEVLRQSLTQSETAACEYFMKHPESVYLSITDVVQNSRISFSGATKDTLRAAEVARINGTTVICLTAFLKAPLVDLSDLCFFLSTNCEPLSCEVFSTIPCEFVLDVLFSELCRIRKTARAAIEKTFDAISDKRI